MVALVQRMHGNAFMQEVLGPRRAPGELVEDARKPAPTAALPEAVEVDLAARAAELIAGGLVDENQVTNELFWTSYPSWRGQVLAPATPGAKKWLEIRNRHARPALAEKHAQAQQVEPVAGAPAKPVKAATPDADKKETETAEPVKVVEPPKPVAEPQQAPQGPGASILSKMAKGAS